MKVTHPEARFCDSVGDSLMIANTHPIQPHIYRCILLLYDCAGLWLHIYLETLMAIHFLGHQTL